MWIKIFVTCKRILTENYWDWKRVTVNQQKILNLIKENPFITQEELSKNIGIARKNGYWQVEEKSL